MSVATIRHGTANEIRAANWELIKFRGKYKLK